MAYLIPKFKSLTLFPWEQLISVEERHHTNYYKFVNMFTDVKHLKENAARRKYLDFLLPTKDVVLIRTICIFIYL